MGHGAMELVWILILLFVVLALPLSQRTCCRRGSYGLSLLVGDTAPSICSQFRSHPASLSGAAASSSSCCQPFRMLRAGVPYTSYSDIVAATEAEHRSSPLRSDATGVRRS